MPLLDRTCLDTMVKIIDASTMLDYVQSDNIVNADDSPQFFTGATSASADSEGWDLLKSF